MGRTKRIRPQADAESLKLLKTIIRDYPELKKRVAVFEAGRKSILMYLNPENEAITGKKLLEYESYYNLNLSQGDRFALQAYFDAQEKIFLLESGLASAPDGRRKEIALEKIIGRLDSQTIMKKYGVSYNTYRRAMKEISHYVGMFIDEYMKWKAQSLYF